MNSILRYAAHRAHVASGTMPGFVDGRRCRDTAHQTYTGTKSRAIPTALPTPSMSDVMKAEEQTPLNTELCKLHTTVSLSTEER